ncbi:MAG: radical SAM protein [Bacteroidales bacterium]|nr:radical SAM protein [Bacteroidales bacterium]
MNQTNLNKENIFAIPVGDLWDVEEDRVYLLYAPLNGHISLASKSNINELEACAAGLSEGEKQAKLLSVFKAKGNVPVHLLPKTPHDLYQIDILTNYTCNFKCIYCYSAAGRSSRQIDFSHIKAVIDYLFCSGKKQENPYIINFSGGGEPLLSFNLIRQTVDYIKEVNSDKHYRYDIGLVTNGSLITPEIVDYLQSKGVNMAVSFEILQRLQDKERGSYEKVASNLDMMLARGYSFGIRTTFTPESVSYMCEMIDEVATRFPKLKKVVFDVVLASSLFPTPQDLANYYDAFLENYYKAKVLAKKNRITLESVAVETLSMIRDRTCEGKIVLTPMGTISSCARVSSPQEPLYNEYTYGEVSESKLQFDQKRFENIISQSNIYSEPICADCFAKWNCGGGCRLFHHSFDERYEQVRCDFMRKSLKRQLIETLGSSFEQTTGEDLFSFISKKLKNQEL